MKFGHFILRKIIKFVATRCQMLRQKCTKINFGWPRSLGELTGPVLLIIEIHKFDKIHDWKSKSTTKVRNPQKLPIIKIHKFHMTKNRNPQNPQKLNITSEMQQYLTG